MAFEFPPPHKASQPTVGKEGPPLGEPRPSFILPPPQGTSTADATETVRQVGQALGQYRELTEWAAETTRNQGEVLVTYGDALKGKVEPWAVPTVAPLSETINRRADPSFQLQGFLHPGFRAQYDDDDGNTDYTRWTEDGDVQWSIPRIAGVKGRTYLTFLTPAINRVYERLNLLVSPVTNPCRMDVKIMLVDPETRVMTTQVDLPNVTVPLGETVASIEFEPWVATQGSYICVAILQSGTGNARTFFGLKDAQRPLPDTVFPRKIGGIHPSTDMTSIPSTIYGTTEVSFDYWFALYVELSENIADRPTMYHEPWPDIGSIGRPWVKLTSSSLYSGGGYVAASGFGYRVGLYDSPLTSENVRVQSSVYRVFTNSIRRSTLVVRSSNNMRSGCGLSVINPGSDNGRYELIAWTNAAPDSNWDNRTLLATVNERPKAGDSLTVDYVGGELVFYLNGQERARVAAPTYNNHQHRFVGVQAERQGSIFNAWPSPWLGPWTARDLDTDNGGDDETGESRVE